MCVLRTQALSYLGILASPNPLLAQLSRSFPSMAWRTVLPVILIVVGLVATGATCLFWKHQRDRDRVQLEEEKLYREEEQLSQGKQAPVGQTCPFQPEHLCRALHEGSPSCTLKHRRNGRDLPRPQLRDFPPTICPVRSSITKRCLAALHWVTWGRLAGLCCGDRCELEPGKVYQSRVMTTS